MLFYTLYLSQYMAAAHIAIITTAVSILFLNGFVGFQWVEDGTKLSVWVTILRFCLDPIFCRYSES
jgi:hypothetical protein